MKQKCCELETNAAGFSQAFPGQCLRKYHSYCYHQLLSLEYMKNYVKRVLGIHKEFMLKEFTIWGGKKQEGWSRTHTKWWRSFLAHVCYPLPCTSPSYVCSPVAHREAEYSPSSKTTLIGNFTQILLNSESSGLGLNGCLGIGKLEFMLRMLVPLLTSFVCVGRNKAFESLSQFCHSTSEIPWRKGHWIHEKSWDASTHIVLHNMFNKPGIAHIMTYWRHILSSKTKITYYNINLLIFLSLLHHPFTHPYSYISTRRPAPAARTHHSFFLERFLLFWLVFASWKASLQRLPGPTQHQPRYHQIGSGTTHETKWQPRQLLTWKK